MVRSMPGRRPGKVGCHKASAGSRAAVAMGGVSHCAGACRVTSSPRRRSSLRKSHIWHGDARGCISPVKHTSISHEPGCTPQCIM